MFFSPKGGHHQGGGIYLADPRWWKEAAPCSSEEMRRWRNDEIHKWKEEHAPELLLHLHTADSAKLRWRNLVWKALAVDVGKQD